MLSLDMRMGNSTIQPFPHDFRENLLFKMTGSPIRTLGDDGSNS